MPLLATSVLSSTAFNTLQNVNLPHLSRLLIAAPLSTVVAFLSCVNTPSNAKFRLECHSEYNPSLDDYFLLSSVLEQRFSMVEDQEPSSHAIRSLVIESTMMGPRLTFNTSERDCDSCVCRPHMEWDCNVPFQIVLGQIKINRDRVISDICCSMPLTYLQSVHIFQPPTSSAFWTRTFGHLQDLRYIKLSQGDMPELAAILYNDCTEIWGERTPDQIFAPRLEELELYDITFAASPPEYDIMGALGTDLQSLQDALSTRDRARLIMTHCFVEGVDEYCYSEPDCAL
ncbi:hypothetical protein OG21DRAFT_911422 [Imleria badia]|nr:hypothetical protein OG21DRAFT_911422 [Imleria badia]